MKKKVLILTLILAFTSLSAFADDVLGGTKVTGNFSFDAQSYRADSVIGATEVPQKILSNGFLNVLMSVGKFNAGIRYEHYLDPILGIDTRYSGSGIPYRFFEFNDDFITVTVGNFYQQFGSGLIFRSYEERVLGLDNAMDGARFKLRPTKGVELIGLIGNQREFWGKSSGLLRGGDINISVGEVFEGLLPNSQNFTIGGSYISRYQDNNNTYYNLPANVTAIAGRANFSGADFNVDAEYAYKINDPNASNKYNFNPGTGFILNASYFTEGLGANINFHRIDNMDFRADRDALGNAVMMSFVPPITKQHDYRLTSIYPYSTKLNGEIGLQTEITYSFPKGSFLAGNYESYITCNFSEVHSLDTVRTLMDTVKKLPLKYDSKFFSLGNQLFFRDINVELVKKWDRKLKTVISAIYLDYNKDVLEAEGAKEYGNVKSFTGVLEAEYKITNKQTVRVQGQQMTLLKEPKVQKADDIYGDWYMLLVEYSFAPNWILTVFDEYNVKKEYDDGVLKLPAKDVHYLNFNAAYTFESTKIMFSYGRQRGGLLCVGGVCRVVPSANGFSLSITSSF